MRKAGFAEGTIGSARFGFDGTILEDIRLSDKLSAKRVTLYAMPGDIIRGRLGSIEITDATGEWPLLPQSENAAPKTMKKITLPAQKIVLSNASLFLIVGDKTLPVIVNGTAEDKNGDVKVDATYRLAGGDEGTLNIQGNGQATVLVPADGKNIQVNTDITDTNADFDVVSLKRIGGWVNVELRPADMTLAAVNAQISSGAGRFAKIPFSEATVTLAQNSEKTDLLLKTTLNNDAGKVDISLTDTPGAKDAATRHLAIKATVALQNLSAFGMKELNGKGDLHLNLAGERGAAQPLQDLSAWRKLDGDFDLSAKNLSLPGVLQDSETAIKAKLSYDPASRQAVLNILPFRWQDSRFNAASEASRLTIDKGGAGLLSAKNIRVAYGETVLEGLGGDIAFKSLSPLVITRQKLSARKLYAGLPLENGSLTFSVADNTKITMHGSHWDMADGKLDIMPFTWSPGAKTDILLKTADISLPLLFQIVPLEGLGGEGRVSGEIPLTLGSDGKLQINNAGLQSTVAGKLSYSPADPPAFLKDETNPQIVLLREALKNFGFDLLKMSFSGAVDGTQTVTLNLQGRNPDLYNGRQINLNLSVEGPLQSVLEYNPAGTKITDDVQRLIDKNRKSK